MAVSRNKNFSWEGSTGDVESSFDKPSDFISTEGRKKFLQGPRATKHIFLRKHIPSNCLLGHERRRFDNSAEKNSTEGLESSSESPKLMKKYIFSEKNSFPSKCYFGNLECSFDNCVETKSKNVREFSFRCPRMKKNASFSKSKILLRLFAWTRIMNFWQPGWRSFIKSLKKIPLISENACENYFSAENFFSQNNRMDT